MPVHAHTTSLAKTTRPGFVQAVVRERLLARLDQSAQKRLVWLGGPPGSGKTTLVSNWIEQRKLAYLWYELDAGDADPATFFFYLAESARRRHGVDGDTLPALGKLPAEDMTRFARRFFRALFAQLPSPVVMVLDNAQDAPPDAALETLMTAAATEMPAAGCVVVVSRGDVPASMARLRASEALAAIRASELRLDRDEVAAMAVARGHPLADTEIDELLERTVGWPAAVVLLIEHAKLAGELAEPPADPTPRVVFDYLGGEIFDRFETPTRELLLAVACLPRIASGIARSLSGEARAEAMLLNLARNGWFVSEMSSGADREFRLHPLLQEFLVERTRASLDETAYAEHLRRAAGLLEAAGCIDDALALVTQAGDFDTAARLLAEHAETVYAQGRVETLASWLDELPRKSVGADALLLYWSARCRTAKHPREARRLFERAYERSRADDDPTRAGLAAGGVIDALLAESEDYSLLDPWIAVIESLPATDPMLPESVLRAACLAHVARAPRAATLAAWGDQLARNLRSAEGPRANRAAWVEFGLARILAGEPDLALETLAELDDAEIEVDNEATALAGTVVRSLACLLRGDAARAREVVQLHSLPADSRGSWAMALRAIDAVTARSDAGAVPTTAAEQDDSGDAAVGSGLERLLRRAVIGWRASRHGDAETAFRYQAYALRAAVDLGAPLAETLCRAGLAMAAAACGDVRRSAAEIRQAQAIAAEHANPLLDFECGLVQAHLAASAGRDAFAERALGEALGVAREHGLAPGPWWRAQDLATLFKRALDAGIEPDYVRRIVRAFALAPGDNQAGAQAWPWPIRIHSLGGFRLAGEALPGNAAERVQGRGTELLKVLVALGASAVRVENVTEAMWPHMDGDYAYRAFTATLHRLRRGLDVDDAVQLADGRVTLNPALCWIDVRALDGALADVDQLLREPRARSDAERLDAAATRLVAHYTGAFLPDEVEHASFLACRERLRAKLLRCGGRLARRLEELQAAERGLDFLERALDADPRCEGLYRQLMEGYARLDRGAEVTETYQRLCVSLGAEAGRAPQPETTALYERLSGGG